MWCFVSLFLVVSTSVIDCLKGLASEMISYMFSETLNPTHLLTCCSLYVSLVLHVYCSIIIRGVMWPETLVL